MIPESLKSLRRWVNWKKIPKKGRPEWDFEKEPLQYCNRPETWLTFEEAETRAKANPNLGIGIQMNGPPVVAWDLDWKRDPAYAASEHAFKTIPPWAQEIIEQQDSYTEWSPSGRGVRIFCSGNLEKNLDLPNGHGQIFGEPGKKFVTVTNATIRDTAIKPYKQPKAESRDAADKVPPGSRNDDLKSEAGRILQRGEVKSAEELIERLQTHAKFHHIDGDPDDPKLESIGRRFWDKYHKDKTLAEVFFTSADDFTAMSFPRRESLAATLEGTPILTGYSLNQVFAFRGTGKTLFQMAWAIAMSRGENFLCYTHAEPMTVGYVEGELPNTVVQERLNMLRDSRPLPNLKLFTRDQMPQGFYLDSEANRNVLTKAVIDNGIKVLFLDSSQSLITKPENDQETWIGLTSWLINLRTSGCCVIITRQTGKDQSRGARGHSAAEDLLDVAIQLTQLDPGRGYLNCKLEYTKFRGVGDIRPIHVEKTVHGPWTYTEVDEELAAEVRELKAGGMSNADIAKELGIRRERVTKALTWDKKVAVPDNTELAF